MLETQCISEIASCLDNFLFDVEVANRAMDGKLHSSRQKIEVFLAFLAD